LENIIAQFEAYVNNKKNQAKMDLEKAYEILEISQTASSEEVKKQYRKLVKQYHPDVITGQGADQETIDKATNKLQEINEAYEIIKTKKGA